jgi:transcription elongation factor GreA
VTMEYFLSKERLEELKKELNELKTVARPKIAEQLKRAAEFGDLSENAEYTQAREERDRIESSIENLEAIVKGAKIIEKKIGQDYVDIGSTVEAVFNGQTYAFTIVGSNEAKPEAGLISNESPLGRALLGRKVGDTVQVDAPAGKLSYTITKIS